METPYGRPDDDLRLQADVAGDLEASGSGLGRYLAARTRYFDLAVVGAIASGIAQVVVAGAGYDGRSLRYSAPGVSWFELDHPSTQADKLERLRRLSIATPGIAFGSVDFSAGDAGAVLNKLGHDRTRPSLFLCEGLAPYLRRHVLSALLAALAGTSATGSRLAIELALAVSSPDQQRRRERLASVVAAVGEPLFPPLSRDEIAPVMLASGWEVSLVTAPDGTELSASNSSVAFIVAVPVARG
ncbi:MAG: class I SAM-dependent methyltransferase [Acidimicrobiales bacterium]